uniref:Uncharacterized protein n=1 Tax=Hydrodictyon reticulatum TaxID=3107 RepID=A0A1W5RN45_HYDRE|nr:hypothetical protein [Hydrodictyon reticulatum]AQU64586.1 hypothetical protein [Hydrodictyon reticulatum]
MRKSEAFRFSFAPSLRRSLCSALAKPLLCFGEAFAPLRRSLCSASAKPLLHFGEAFAPLRRSLCFTLAKPMRKSEAFRFSFAPSLWLRRSRCLRFGEADAKERSISLFLCSFALTKPLLR